jgi:hypothetical protein
MFWGFDLVDKEPLNIDMAQEMRNAYKTYKTFGNHDGIDYWATQSYMNPFFGLLVCDLDASYVDITDFNHHNER